MPPWAVLMAYGLWLMGGLCGQMAEDCMFAQSVVRKRNLPTMASAVAQDMETVLFYLMKGVS